MTKKTTKKKSSKIKKGSSSAKKKIKKAPVKKKAGAKKALTKKKSPPLTKKAGKTPVKKAEKALAKKKSPPPTKKAGKTPVKKIASPPSKKKTSPVTESRASSSLSYRKKELKKILEKEKEEKMILKSMKGKTYCIVENCDYPAIVEDYCRIHFFGLFKYIQKKKKILEQDLLTKSYISLVEKYSPTILEYLLKDLSSEKNFKSAVKKIIE